MNREELEAKELISRKTNAVYDFRFIQLLKSLPWGEWYEQDRPLFCRERYLETIDRWIHQSKLNRIAGLERFHVRHLINGTTQTFDEAYFTHGARRLRFFRGEYAYHRRVFRNWLFLEDAPLQARDFVIVSAPFCSTGDVHPRMSELLDEAERLGVPVIVDCAYFGTCEDFYLDVSHPAIESVSFSLTKGLGMGDIRSGIRYSNLSGHTPISQQNEYDHTILAAARIGLYMMENVGPDFIPETYSRAQKSACQDAGLIPTKCMHLALAEDATWDEYRVDDLYRRVGIRNFVKARRRGEV